MIKLISKIATTLVLALFISAAFAGDASMVIPAALGLEILSLMVPMGVVGADVYADTVLQAARAFIKDQNNKKFQLRPQTTRLIDIFMKDREYTLPSLSSLRSATTRATEALYLKKKAFTIGTSKSCEPTGEQSGSAKVSLTWNTKNVKIYTSFKQHAGNLVDQARALANDLYNAEVSLWTGASGVDAALLTYLESNKSGVNAGGSGTFDATNDIMAINLSSRDDFYNLVTADMQMNNYNPIFLEAHNTMWTAAQRKYVNQGAGNSTNTQFQFAGFEFFPSNLITPGVIGSNTYDSVHYIVPSEGVAILDWNDPINRAGKVSGNKSWGTFQSILMPGITFDLFKISDCADTSSDGGGTQDYTEVWELSFNYALAKQPVAGAGETPIFKYGIMNDSTFAS